MGKEWKHRFRLGTLWDDLEAEGSFCADSQIAESGHHQKPWWFLDLLQLQQSMTCQSVVENLSYHQRCSLCPTVLLNCVKILIIPVLGGTELLPPSELMIAVEVEQYAASVLFSGSSRKNR